MSWVRYVAVAILGIGLVVLGCQTQLVGHDELHGYLVSIGVVAILFGVMELL